MDRDQKAAVVDEIAAQLEGAEAVFAIDYRGISVSQAAELRDRLHDAGAAFRVVKNSLTERAADKVGASELKELLEGPTALTFVSGDPALAAKALNDTARALRLLDFKGGVMNGTALSADEIRSLARLPAREVLHGQLVGTVAAPLSGLVRTLNAMIAGLASQLQQMAETWPTSEPTRDESEAEAESESTPVGSDADQSPPKADEPATDAGEPAAEAAAEAPAEVATEPAAEGEADAAAEAEPDQAEQETEPESQEET